MNLISIFLFFLYSWGFGFTATYLIKLPERTIGRFFLRVGVGLGVWIVVGIILNVLQIPLLWWIFLILSSTFPAYTILKKKKIRFKIFEGMSKGKLTFSKELIYELFVLALAIILFLVYLHATFDPGFMPSAYFADGDPYQHAGNSKYVALEHTYTRPVKQINYLSVTNAFEPYPQGMPIIYGIIHQTSPSIFWNLKFFNQLIIAMGLIWFYYLVKKVFKNPEKALTATFLLFAIPSFLTRFIWPSAITLNLYFIALYFAEIVRTKRDWRWAIPGGIVVGAIMVTQGTTNIIFGLVFIIFVLLDLIISRKFNWWLIVMGALGLVIAALFFVPIAIQFPGFLTEKFVHVQDVTGVYAQNYKISDFIIAKTVGKIDNTIGWGIIMTGLFIIGLLFSKKKGFWPFMLILWTLFSLVEVNSINSPLKFFPHRWWAILAMPLVMLAAEGWLIIISWLKKFGVPSLLITLVLISGVALTSAYPKYQVNTASWPLGMFADPTELASYLWLKDLPENTMVMPLCSRESKVIAYDKLSKGWIPEILDFHENWGFNATAEESYAFLKRYSYQYVLLDISCTKKFGVNETNLKLQDYVTNNHYRLDYPRSKTDPNGAFAFRLI